MANMTSNEWVMRGPPEALDAFAREFLDPQFTTRPSVGAGTRWLGRILGVKAPATKGVALGPTLSFERLRPEPAGIAGRDQHDWRVENWGTTYQVDLPTPAAWDRVAPDRAHMEIVTAYAPPTGIMRALAERLPRTVRVDGTYVEPGNDLAGRFTIADGTLTDALVPLGDGFEMILSGPWRDDDDGSDD